MLPGCETVKVVAGNVVLYGLGGIVMVGGADGALVGIPVLCVCALAVKVYNVAADGSLVVAAHVAWTCCSLHTDSHSRRCGCSAYLLPVCLP